MNTSALLEILERHYLWLAADPNGEKAILQGVDLHGLDLHRTRWCKVDLQCADLRETNLQYADFLSANLRGADLRGANLYGACISYADITDVKIDGTTKWFNLRCPAEGAYIGYKKCRGGLIVKLEIPADAKRSSATTEKCRASKAKVISITNLDGSPAGVEEAFSLNFSFFVYHIGETVEVLDFDENRWNECSRGIHHFMTRQEAVDYRN